MRRRGGMNPFLAGVLGIAVIAVGCYFGFTKTNPFHDPFELSAAFRTANDIKKGSAVRIAGVNIGKVTDVRSMDDGDGAIVKMEIEKAGLPIHEDATMKIRPRIFLEGNWFVDIKPGTPGAPVIEEGETIPVQQTATPVQFGQVLETLQSDTRQDLQIVLDEYGRALMNGGALAYNRSIDHWTKAFRDSAIVNQAMLGREPHDLSNYLKGADKFARGLDRDPEALKDLITNLAITADALADEDVNLSRAIRALPRTLSAGRLALGELNEAFPPLRRLVADMRPTVRESGPALDAQLPLIKQLRKFVSEPEMRGLVRDLRPVVANLTELNEGGVALQQELRLLSSCTNEVLTPWRNSTVPDHVFPASGPVYQEQVKWMPGIAAESRNFDANGQYVRSLANGMEYAYPLGDDRFFFSGAPIQGVNPPKAPNPPPLRPEVDCETQQPPDLRSNPAQPPAAKKVNFDAPGAAEARAAEMAKAVDWLRGRLKEQGLDIPVVEKLIEPADLDNLTKSIPAVGGAK